jgi:hypothetical protein
MRMGFWGMVLVLTTLVACESTNAEQTASTALPSRSTTATLFLIDKTKSATGDSLSLENYQSLTKACLNDRFKDTGERILGALVHARTLGVDFVFNETIEARPESTEGKGGVTIKQEEKRFLDQRNQEMRDGYKRIVQQLKAENPYASSKQTDLWATFELISRALQQHPECEDFQVVFLSDMVESMEGEGRRDFHKELPQSRAEAETFAKEDAQWIRNQFKVDDSSFDRVSVKIWTPYDSARGFGLPESPLLLGSFIRSVWHPRAED